MKRKGEKLPPFTALFRHTTKSAAWTAMSVGARAAFFEMQSNYNTKAQNAVFLSARDGARKLGGVRKDTVMKWQRELEYYGFIVKVQGAHLGLNGVGKAALYRLTDRHYAGQAPTYEFLNWDGEVFHEQKRPSYYQAKKQNPVPPWRTTLSRRGGHKGGHDHDRKRPKVSHRGRHKHDPRVSHHGGHI